MTVTRTGPADAGTTFALPAKLTLAQAREQVQGLEQALGGGSGNVVVIDATALHTFDTSAIAVLLEARRLAQAAGHKISVRGAPQSMIDLARLYGVADLLSFQASAGAA